VLAVNTPVFHRQRAERFAQLLDEASGARRRHARSRTDQELTEFVDVSQRLAGIDFGVQADPEFRDGLRAMLMATIEREGIGAAATARSGDDTVVLGRARHRQVPTNSVTSWIPVRSRRARVAVVIGLAAGTLAVSGMSAASGDAVPGDALYGMKRSTERAQLALASSQVGRGQLYLEFAKTRMNEAAAVRGDAPGLAGVLDDMDNETREGVRLLTTAAIDRRDPAALDAISAFTGEQRHTMTGMLSALAGGARERTIGSLALLDAIDKRVDGLRGGLRCGDIASTTSDELGPKPRMCAAQGPARSPARGGEGSNIANRAAVTESASAATGTGASAAAPSGVGTSTAQRAASGATSDTPTPAAADATSKQATQPHTVSTSSTPSNSAESDESFLDRIGHLLGGLLH
jgi:hypothetical protein